MREKKRINFFSRMDRIFSSSDEYAVLYKICRYELRTNTCFEMYSICPKANSHSTQFSFALFRFGCWFSLRSFCAKKSLFLVETRPLFEAHENSPCSWRWLWALNLLFPLKWFKQFSHLYFCCSVFLLFSLPKKKFIIDVFCLVFISDENTSSGWNQLKITILNDGLMK